MIYTIFKKEINTFFSSPTAYIALGLYISILWLFCWLLSSSSFIEYGFAEMTTFFSVAPYLLMFLIPAITMHMIAEERAMGTLDFLFSKPLSALQMILGKYFASLLLIFIAITFSFFFPYSLFQMGNPVGNIDLPATFGAYFGLFCLAAVFCAIGIFSTSITHNQILAFLLAFFINYVLYEGFSRVAEIGFFSGVGVYILEQMGLLSHYNSLGRGVIALSDLVYFANVIVLFIFLTWSKMKLFYR